MTARDQEMVPSGSPEASATDSLSPRPHAQVGEADVRSIDRFFNSFSQTHIDEMGHPSDIRSIDAQLSIRHILRELSSLFGALATSLELPPAAAIAPIDSSNEETVTIGKQCPFPYRA